MTISNKAIKIFKSIKSTEEIDLYSLSKEQEFNLSVLEVIKVIDKLITYGLAELDKHNKTRINLTDVGRSVLKLDE